MTFTVADLPANMQNKIVDKDGCWNWTGAKNPKGYGSVSNGRRSGSMLAHRRAYMATVGEIPNGYEIDHLCENTSCVNPAHLEAVTRQEHRRRIGHQDLLPVYAPQPRPYAPDPEVQRVLNAFIDRVADSRRRYEEMSPEGRADHDARRHRLHVITGSRCACAVAS